MLKLKKSRPKLIAVIIDLNELINSRKYINYFELLNNLQDDSIFGSVIDISQIFRFKKKKINYEFAVVNKNQFFFQPKNILDLIKLFNIYKCISIYNFPTKISFLLPHLFLRILNTKRFAISGLGYLSDNSVDKSTSLKNKFLYFKNYKFSYYVFRIFQIFSFFKKIDFYFEASQKTIDNINNSFSYKLKKKIKFLDLSFYKRKFRINSNAYNLYINYKNNFNNCNKYIVLVDSGFDHTDRIIREGKPSNNLRKEYYKILNNFLKKISDLTLKEIIICLHPKVDYGSSDEYLQIKKNFKTVLNKTNEFIYQSDICIFFESSAIINAILLKKKIINLNTKLMGNYFFKRNNLYKDYIDLYQINLENYKLPEKKIDLYKILENKTQNYENYINENILFEENKSSYDQVKSILNEYYFK
jgi:hypothetical protein